MPDHGQLSRWIRCGAAGLHYIRPEQDRPESIKMTRAAFILIVLAAIASATADPLGPELATCTDATRCRACRDCTRCRHCNAGQGACGVCAHHESPDRTSMEVGDHGH